MIDGSELVDTSRYQSLFQLGTAVALAYLVAGPELRKILRPQIDVLFGLRKKLAKFHAERRPGNIAARAELVRLASKVLSTGRYRADRVNLPVTTLHLLLALGCFAFLLHSSVYAQMTSGWVLIGCVTVACAIFMDPILILVDARYLSKLLSLVCEIGSVPTPCDPDGHNVREACAAVGSLSEGKQTVIETLNALQAIQSRNAA